MAAEKHSFDPVSHDEASETLHAIRRGAVDAFVVEEAAGRRVYALESADLPYSAMVERMHQGAAMLNESGDFLSCNPSLAALLGVVKQELIGKPLQDFLAEEDWKVCSEMLSVSAEARECEVHIRRVDGSSVPVKLSWLALAPDKTVNGLLVSDLTAEKQREEFSVALRRIQDEERRNIARELHDSVGQSLAAISMNLGSVLAERDKLTDKYARAAEDSARLVNSITKEIRTITYLLHPPLLELAGLAAALKWYVDGFSERSKIRVDVEIPPDLPALSSEADLAVYRVVQECLTNVHRHSGADWCSLKMTYRDGRMYIEVRDSGRGIPADKLTQTEGGSLGLRGMQERLRQLGGALELHSDGLGTVVTASLPVPDTEKSKTE